MRIRRPDIAFDGRERRAANMQLFETLPAVVAQGVPAGQIGLSIPGNVLGRSVQREVRSREGEELEERLTWVLLGMFLQTLNGVVGDGRAGVVASVGRDWRQRLVVLRVAA